jgi:hypothetical protein
MCDEERNASSLYPKMLYSAENQAHISAGCSLLSRPLASILSIRSICSVADALPLDGGRGGMPPPMGGIPAPGTVPGR